MNKRATVAAVGPALTGLAVSALVWARVPNPMPIHWDANGDTNGIVVLFGALFGGLGLVMPHLKQNRWAGVRTPWTLGDEVN